jgi:hypothetical protein
MQKAMSERSAGLQHRGGSRCAESQGYLAFSENGYSLDLFVTFCVKTKSKAMNNSNDQQ